MDETLNDSTAAILPFSNCSDYQLFNELGANLNFYFDNYNSTDFFKEISEYTSTFTADNFKCKYYNEQQFNSTFPQNLPNSLRVFHLNIRSFSLHQFELVAFLNCLKIEFDIILLTETGLISQSLIEREFPDFILYADPPKTKKGGAGILIRKNIFYDVEPLNNSADFSFNNNCPCNKCLTESQFLKLKSNTNEFIIGSVYRHPNGNPVHFNTEYFRILENMNKKSICIIGGDFNLNMLDYDKQYIRNYVNNTMENNFVPCITLPSRITSSSSTLIDHIMLRLPINKIQCKVNSGNFICDITDHLPNFVIINLNIKHQNYRPFIRLFTPNKINEFNENIDQEMSKLNQNLDLTFHTNDVNLIYSNFFINYKNILDRYFPKVKMSRKKAKDKPWITEGLKTSIKTRNKLFENYHKNKTEENEKKGKTYRNNFLAIVCEAEVSYYKNLITKHNNSCNSMWKIFGNILKNKSCSTKVTKLKCEGKTLIKPNDISEAFNNFFTNIGETLSKEFDNDSNSSYNKYINTQNVTKLKLSGISTNEIIHEINNLEIKKSNGYDDIPTLFLKLTKNLVSKPLAKIYNLSVKTGTYPSHLKIAKVTPIYKKGDPQSPSNYRPISVLTHINKIFEKVLFNRLSSHLTKHNLLYNYQYGFREGHSTTQALVELTDNLKTSIDNGNHACGIFIDLTKAFDTVNHSILIDKLNKYGVSGKANSLLKSYLENRVQYVEVNNSKSSHKDITCGVPQGSVLGPLLFLIYINDLPNCSPLGNIRIFADDTAIFFECNDPTQLAHITENIMNNISEWFKANKLTLNLDKSNFCIFRSVKNKNKPIPESIKFGDKQIYRVSHIKYLGLYLDEHLSFSYHINEVCKSLRKYFPVFYNIRRYLNNAHIKAIYYSMIYSKIKYGILTYGLTTATNLNKVQIIQNKLLKVITNQKYRTPTNDLHNSLEILKVKDILTQETLSFVHNFTHNKLPIIFNNYFRKFNDIHDRNTRNRNNFIIPRSKTVLGSKTIKYIGTVTWNALDQNIKLIDNIKKFRLSWKKIILPY